MSNFKFLKKEEIFKTFANACIEAESSLGINAVTTAIMSRRALELAVKWMYANDKDLNIPYQDNISTLIHDITFRNIIDGSLFNEIKYVIKLGNFAVHNNKKISRDEVVLSLNYLFRKMSSRLLLLFAAFIGFAIIGIQQYRLYKTYGVDNTIAYFSHINPSGYPDALIAAHLPCHVGATVFSDIVNFSSFSGSLHGRFAISIFGTILPGIQMGPRTFISLLRETSLASSTTPSILGGPYLDFGVLGIALFMFLVGLLLTFLYLVMESSQKSFNTFCHKINVVSYSYLLSILIISIHSGLLDPIIIFSIVFIIFLQSLANDWFNRRSALFVWLLTLFIFVVIIIYSIMVNS